jgi:hypothetical protein
MSLNVKYLSSRKGSAVVDYLMIIGVIAGIAVPIVMKYFGEPLMRTMTSQREKLVSFVAQTPKRTVPNIWFSRERVVDPGGGDLEGAKDMNAAGELGNADSLNAGGDLKNARNMRAAGNLKSPGVKGAGELGGAGNVGGSNLNGAAGFGGRGGGGVGSSGGADPALDGDFFGGGGGDKKAGAPAEAEDGKSGGMYGKGYSGDGEASRSGGGGGRDGGGGMNQGGNREGEKGQRITADSKKRNAELLSLADDEERARAKPFDWWMLIKILIVLLILFILLLIALSNMKNAR